MKHLFEFWFWLQIYIHKVQHCVGLWEETLQIIVIFKAFLTLRHKNLFGVRVIITVLLPSFIWIQSVSLWHRTIYTSEIAWADSVNKLYETNTHRERDEKVFFKAETFGFWVCATMIRFHLYTHLQLRNVRNIDPENVEKKQTDFNKIHFKHMLCGIISVRNHIYYLFSISSTIFTFDNIKN